MRAVYRVTLAATNQRTKEPYWINFECGYPSLEAFVSELNEGRLVIGDNLRTQRSEEPGAVEVIARKTIALGRSGILLVEPPSMRFVEFEERADG